jgi:transmembrane sensor
MDAISISNFFYPATRPLVVFNRLIIETMDSLPTYDNLPWDMILSALQGELSPDEERQFRQWLAVSADNQQQYDRLRRIWEDGLADYAVYQEADEVKALAALHERIGHRIGPSIGRGVPVMGRWTVAAAVILLAAGAGWWYLSGKGASVGYETAYNEQKSVSLPDGTTMDLTSQTHVEVVPGYNKTNRTVILGGGEAHFDVSHQERLPFIVDMDVAMITDLGTAFTIQRTKDSIKVTVSAGRIAFHQKKNGESREVSAGNSLVFYILENRFGVVQAMDTSDSGAGALQFHNSTLSDVIAVLQKANGTKISLSDTALGQKRLTVDLNGVAFGNAIKIICASLNLEYAEKNGGYILKNSKSPAHAY